MLPAQINTYFYAGIALDGRLVFNKAHVLWGEQRHPRVHWNSCQPMAADTIFVQIAAFRDPEYMPTVHSMFSRAVHPENIRLGAVLQYDWKADADCFKMAYPPGLRVDEIKVDAVDSGGVCWARNLCQTLYQGERFTLQLDSHMRFVQGWDVQLTQMWRSLNKSKAVLTCYPPNYEPGKGRERRQFSGLGARCWKRGTLWFAHEPTWSVLTPPPRPQVGAFVAGGMLFGPGRMIGDVQYDPYLERHGEESTLAVRLWTNGYDIFHPNKILIWHRATQNRPMDHQVIPGYERRIELSAKRCQALLSRLQCDDPAVTIDLEKYGLGSVRTLQEYEEWSGVDFMNQTFSDDAKLGLFKSFKRKKAASSES